MTNLEFIVIYKLSHYSHRGVAGIFAAGREGGVIHQRLKIGVFEGTGSV